jgi:hypothetical protein
VVALVVASLAWYFASPLYTLKQMQSAAQANDADRLSAYIDYPTLREDMKSELMAQMLAESQKDGGAFGPLGLAIGTAMIGPMIDGMVSPAGVRAMFLSKRQEAEKAGNQAPAIPAKVAEDPVIERRSLSEFVVRSKSKPDGGMVFRRHGLSWKLSGMDLPADLSSKPVAPSS